MSERPLPRRAFLGYASLGASAIWMPRWLTAGFSSVSQLQDPPSPGTDQEEPIPTLDVVMSQGLERARRMGKPLLAFVVPIDKRDVQKRQSAFGQYLNLCSDEALADLALCEVVCAGMSDVESVVPGSGTLGEPWMILVETGGADPTVRAIEGELPEIPVPSMSKAKDWDDFQKEQELAILRRVERLAELVHQPVAGDPSILERRGAQARDVAPQDLLGLVDRLVQWPNLVPPEALDKVAAPVRIAAESQPDRRASCIVALAEAARQRLRLHPPAGAWWAAFTGCSHVLEGRVEKRDGRFGCGMARISKLSRRFLHFYTTQCK